MSSVANFRKILDIVSKYSEKGEEHSYFICAEHDQIYFHDLTEDVVSEEDAKILEEAGCYFDEDVSSWCMFV